MARRNGCARLSARQQRKLERVVIRGIWAAHCMPQSKAWELILRAEVAAESLGIDFWGSVTNYARRFAA